MSSRCNICVDPNCNGKFSCSCETCDKRDLCYRMLRPTIRITTKCTQSCKHCCFSCSPSRNDFMTIEKAREINKFLINNNIEYTNIMGGEFFTHPDWFNIITTLCSSINLVRIVTNGDWVGIEDKKIKLLSKELPIYFAISKDKWHTNKNVEAARDFCLDNDILHKVATKDQVKAESIVPIGRSEFEYNFYSMFGRYCTKPDRKYEFLIDEQGVIHKCPMGIWQYADVLDFLGGGFDERFKEFTSVFYSELILNCATCIRAWQLNTKRGNIPNNKRSL